MIKCTRCKINCDTILKGGHWEYGIYGIKNSVHLCIKCYALWTELAWPIINKYLNEENHELANKTFSMFANGEFD